MWQGFDRRRSIRPDLEAHRRLLIALALFLVPWPVLAQTLLFESEPNDTPDTFQPVSGAFIAAGQLTDGDQDGYRWSVSDVEARYRWDFRLQGVPGALTVVDVYRLQTGPDGQILEAKELLTVGSRDGSVPGVAEGLLFAPGDYLLGVAYSGGGDTYRPPMDAAGFEPGKTAGGAAEPGRSGSYRVKTGLREELYLVAEPENGSRDAARDLRFRNEFVTYSTRQESWYRLDVGDREASEFWDVSLQIPLGQGASAELIGPDGTTLASETSDRNGRLVFRDLRLDVGEYLVGMKRRSEEGSVVAIRVASGGEATGNREGEPNDQPDVANRVDLSSPLQGRIGTRRDRDHFLFSLGAEDTEEKKRLRLVAPESDTLELCLLDPEGSELQCREGEAEISLQDLVLGAGEYVVRVQGRREGVQYELSLSDTGAPQRGRETEPNDTLGRASALMPPRPVAAAFAGEDTDFHRLIVEGEAQLWRIQAMGDGLAEIRYHDGAGIQNQRKQARGRDRMLRLDNLYLLPGTHYVSVSGVDGDYRLIARPLGPPDPTLEREPNDDPQRMQPLEIGSKRIGLLADTEDTDYYRFHLADWQRIRLSVAPPPGGEIAARLFWDDFEIGRSTGRGQSTSTEREGLFPPGDYQVALTATTPSDGEYILRLEALPRFGCAGDCEPNDHIGLASPIPPSLTVSGYSGDWSDYDYYELPVFGEETPVTIRTQGGVNVDLVDASDERAQLERQPDDTWRGTLPAGRRLFARLKSRGPYQLEFEFDGALEPAPVNDATLDVALESPTRAVAGFRSFGQRFRASVEVSNPGATDRRVMLATAASDARWTVTAEAAEFSLPAGASRSVPVTVDVPADAHSGTAITLYAGASQNGATWNESALTIRVRDDADPAGMTPGWSIPSALRGRWNLAAGQLGAERLTLAQEDPDDPGRIPDVGIGFDDLFDGVALRGAGLLLERRAARTPVDVPVRLAGAPATIYGFALDTTGRTRVGQHPRRVELAVSGDGDDWTTVADAELSPLRREQYVVLDAPVEASYARLRLTDNWVGDGRVGLGEWKVMGTPGGPLPEAIANLADPELGGHIVRSHPPVGPDWDRGILTAEQDVSSLRLDGGETLEFVVGFHHDRAAWLAALEWTDSEKAAADETLQAVRASYSTHSPLGPWQPLAEWNPQTTPKLTLEEPVSARFLRITARAPASGGKVWPPETLRIYERPHSADYRSILAEWGADEMRASLATRIGTRDPMQTVPDNSTRATAHELRRQKWVTDSARLATSESWFRLRTGPEENRLSLTLRGDPALRVVARLEDADGDAVDLETLERSPTEILQEATLAPDRSYWLRVTEPQRNVVFAWDTSGSVAAQLPLIYSALGRYASGIEPGRDAANLLPFGAQPLLRDWYSEPYILETVLNEYPRAESSSAAERTLATAARALEPRDGVRAVVLLTDAATSRYPEMWSWMDAVRPRIFAIRVGEESGASFTASEEDLMQDWSLVNGGYYAYGASAREVEVAWRRATSLLRRPALFSLRVDMRNEPQPGPGEIRVIAGETVSASPDNAALLILDASGSMLQRLEGRRRIDVARDVLTEAVADTLPAGMPVALRVFGHREPGTCRTDLVMPLQPLDPDAVRDTLAGITAKNLARTPIADSLSKVRSDLSGVTGRRVVVLITDGEETCDGDPAAVIARLGEQGIEFTLNIVGFAIEDTGTEQMFRRWAETGGGAYFAATDSGELRQAVSKGLRTGYRVYDQSGTLVHEGVVDDPATRVPAGFYRIVVNTSPPSVYEDVRIRGGTARVLDLSDPDRSGR